THRRPCFSTSARVSSSCSSVLLGYSVPIGAQMSQITTSAPASAKATACDRPCPRAPPVTNATWPLKSYISRSSFARGRRPALEVLGDWLRARLEHRSNLADCLERRIVDRHSTGGTPFVDSRR